MDWKTIKRELAKKLDPDHINAPPPGKFGNYMPAHTVLKEANRIFGPENWSYEVVSLAETNSGVVTITPDRGAPYQQFRVGYVATVRVTVEVEGKAVRKMDAGHGQGMTKVIAEGDAHDSAIKEAVTDALKRALRTFGNPLGLALYDKGDNPEIGREPAEADHNDADYSVKNAIALIEDADCVQHLTDVWKGIRKNNPQLAKNSSLIQAAKDRKAVLEGAS